MDYRLRFPFKPIHWIKDFDEPVEFGVATDLRARVRTEAPYVVIDIEAFPSEDAALAYAPRVWNCLGYMAVQMNTGFFVDMTPSKVDLVDDPEKTARELERSMGVLYTGPVHGWVDSQFPAAVPIGLNIRTTKFGTMTGSVTWPKDVYVAALARNLNSVLSAQPYDNRRLRLAIELFSQSQREVSMRSRFLTLVIALEVLAEPSEKHPNVVALLSEFAVKVKTALDHYPKDSDEYHALQSLHRDALFRKRDSLRSSLRRLVLDSLAHEPEPIRVARSKEMVDAYDLRGKLVHEGELSTTELNTAHDIAWRTLLWVLAAKLSTDSAVPRA